MKSRFCRAAGLVLLAGLALYPDPALAYQKGEIVKKAQPIIDILKDVAEPIAYGCYIWAFIKYILGHRGEAIQLMKSVTWGYIGIQILPWLFSIIKSIGE